MEICCKIKLITNYEMEEHALTPDETLIIFSQRITELRHLKGISRNKLAKDLHIAPVSLAKYEAGIKFPKLTTIVNMAEYYNVSLDYLFGITDNPYIKK